jgi:hypothetical protein
MNNRKLYEVTCQPGVVDLGVLFNGINGVEVRRVDAAHGRADVLIADEALHTARRRVESCRCAMHMRLGSLPLI